MLRRSVFVALATLVFGVSTANATSITVSTGHVQANTQIDVDNWFVWTFTVAPSVSVDEILGKFVIKDNDASAPITFSVFNQNASAWTLADINAAVALDSTSLGPADVDNQWTEELFELGPSPALTNSSPIYSLVLWSNTPGQGSYQFFFKGRSNETLVVTPCGVIAGENVECPGPDPHDLPDMPEPSTVILTLSGLAILAVRRWRG